MAAWWRWNIHERQYRASKRDELRRRWKSPPAHQMGNQTYERNNNNNNNINKRLSPSEKNYFTRVHIKLLGFKCWRVEMLRVSRFIFNFFFSFFYFGYLKERLRAVAVVSNKQAFAAHESVIVQTWAWSSWTREQKKNGLIFLSGQFFSLFSVGYDGTRFPQSEQNCLNHFRWLDCAWHSNLRV